MDRRLLPQQARDGVFFAGELAVDDLDGEIAWQRRDGGWQIDARKLQLASAEAECFGIGAASCGSGSF